MRFSLTVFESLGVEFVIECRVTDVEFPLFSLLKKAGLKRVHIGIESGLQRMLNSLDKHTTVEQNMKAISILKELGIEFHPNFILVDPETTLEELRQSLTFIKTTRIYRAHRVHALFSNQLGLFAGTPIFEQYKKLGRAKPRSYPHLSQEDQRITDEIGAVSSYDLDARVEWFIALNNKVIHELERRDGVLKKLQVVLHQKQAMAQGHSTKSGGVSNLLPAIEQWYTNAGALSLRVFEEALSRTEKEDVSHANVEPYLSEILSELDRYDSIHFGMTVDELSRNIREFEMNQPMLRKDDKTQWQLQSG